MIGVQNVTAYGLFSRTKKKDSSPKVIPTPILTCSDKNDTFTVRDTEKGNSKLTYPVGLITGDKIILAGANHTLDANTDFYLYKGYPYWSMSPFYLWPSHRKAYVAMVGTDGIFEDGDDSIGGGLGVRYSSGLAPVINLTPETVSTLIETGISTDPYRLPGDTV